MLKYLGFLLTVITFFSNLVVQANARQGEVIMFIRGEFGSEGIALDYRSGKPNPFQYAGPNSMAAGADGSLWVVDSGNQRIRIFDQKGNATGFLAFLSIEAVELPEVTDIALARDLSMVFLLDRANGRVWALGRDGTCLGSIPLSTLNLESSDVYRLAVDSEKSLYLHNLEKRRVLKYSSQGESLYSIDGIESFSVTDSGSVIGIAFEGDPMRRGIYRYSPDGSFEVCLGVIEEKTNIYVPEIIGIDKNEAVYVTYFTYEKQIFQVFTKRGDVKEKFEKLAEKRYIFSSRSECAAPDGSIIAVSDDGKGLTFTRYRP